MLVLRRFLARVSLRRPTRCPFRNSTPSLFFTESLAESETLGMSSMWGFSKPVVLPMLFLRCFLYSSAVLGDKRRFASLLSPAQSGEIAFGALSPRFKSLGRLSSEHHGFHPSVNAVKPVSNMVVCGIGAKAVLHLGENVKLHRNVHRAQLVINSNTAHW